MKSMFLICEIGWNGKLYSNYNLIAEYESDTGKHAKVFNDYFKFNIIGYEISKSLIGSSNQKNLNRRSDYDKDTFRVPNIIRG